MLTKSLAPNSRDTTNKPPHHSCDRSDELPSLFILHRYSRKEAVSIHIEGGASAPTNESECLHSPSVAGTRPCAVGRPKRGKYEYWLTPDGLLLLGAWARDGLTLEQIAEKCGCTRETLRQWRNTYPAISAALKRNADIVDAE